MAETFYQSADDRNNDDIAGYLIAKPVQDCCKPCIERHGIPVINSTETVLQRIEKLDEAVRGQSEINRHQTEIIRQQSEAIAKHDRTIQELQNALRRVGDEVATLRRHLLNDYEALEALKTAHGLLVLEIAEQRQQGNDVALLLVQKHQTEQEIYIFDQVHYVCRY
jgi:septal ring factor EnvC (AmiA/AmiB activator)